MSSFVITTKDGPPEIFVEVGKPFAKDPYLISGIFKAIYSVSNELTSNPLQVIQAKGFTVKFRQLHDGSILMVGTDHNVAGLEILLNQCFQIIEDGRKYDLGTEEVEVEIKKVIESYFSNKFSLGDEEEEPIPRPVTLGFHRLPKNIVRVIFWGVLTQRHFRFPNTGSLDFDNYISSIVDFLGQPCCSNLETSCPESIRFINEKGDFLIDDGVNTFNYKDIGIKKTNLLKKLEKMASKGKVAEVREIVNSSRETISGIHKMIENYPELSEDVKFEIDKLRYSIGLDLEHYLIEYLKLIEFPHLQAFLSHAERMEWVNPWLF